MSWLLPPGLPEGHLVTRPGQGTRPACWISDAPIEPGVWSRLRADHPRSGLWPLLVLDDVGDGYFGWDPCEELSALDEFDVEAVLSEWWQGFGEGFLTRAECKRLDIRNQQSWPGLAEPGTSEVDADVLADELAEATVAEHSSARLALARAPSGADALAVSGWEVTDDESHGPRELATVVRDWERRFGARVLSIGSGSLDLSVAAPPTTLEHAFRVAVEHLPFSPEVSPYDLEFDESVPDFSLYARSIVGRSRWSFWWD